MKNRKQALDKKQIQMVERIRETISSFPISFALLVGSQSTGLQTPLSDIDVAISFCHSVSSDECLSFVAEIMDRLIGVFDCQISVIDLSRVPPVAGYHMFKTGVIILDERLGTYEKEFARAIGEYLDFQHVLDVHRRFPMTMETG